MDTRKAIDILVEYNKWRRGESPYDWSENPANRKDFPYNTKVLGQAIDHAIMKLVTIERTKLV